MRQESLFQSQRTTLEDAVEMALDSLRAYAPHYRHWALAYSGGKDSSTLATLIPWAILTGRLPRPESLTLLEEADIFALWGMDYVLPPQRSDYYDPKFGDAPVIEVEPVPVQVGLFG